METSYPTLVRSTLLRRIGPYEAFLKIGGGGMADVYLSVHRGPFDANRLVAIKQLRPEVAAEPDCVAMFVAEARIALRLDHPNLVRAHEVLQDVDEYCLVMEFLDGHSLRDVLSRVERTNMPLYEHVWILTQLLAGLHYAHELCDFDGTPLGIVHCDVTPSNVFVGRSGEVKLLDFGIAKVRGTATETRQGVLKGKVGYLAPELCVGEPATVASDIYAVGVMLWEAIARRRRVTGETPAARLKARVRGSEPPIDQVCPSAPPTLVAVARRALSLHPDRRYASAQEFQRALEAFLIEEQSAAGATSVSRLLHPYFERDRVALFRAIEAHLAAERTPEPADVFALATRDVSAPIGEDDDTRTAPVPVDRALLLASMLERDFAARPKLLWNAFISRVRSVPKPQPSPRLALAVAGTVALALTTWLATRAPATTTSRSAVTADRRPRVERLPPLPAAEPPAREPAPAIQHEPARIAISNARELHEESASAAEVLQEPAEPTPAPITARAARRSRAFRAARQRASAASVERLDPARIEPGMDMPSAAKPRLPPTIDQEDPYAP